jgi:uncharacterized protein (TIGR01244 family)
MNRLKGSLSLMAAGIGFALLSGCTRAATESGEVEMAAEEHRAITTERLEPYECGTITRLHTMGGVFLASQPQPSDIEQAKKGGVKSVINLRHREENTDFDEQAVVADLGLNYYNLPWNGPDELNDQIFDDSRKLLNTVERPILLHCSSANRVGAVWIPWRVLDGGADIEEAVAEAKVIGLKSPDYETKARDYVKRHLP